MKTLHDTELSPEDDSPNKCGDFKGGHLFFLTNVSQKTMWLKGRELICSEKGYSFLLNRPVPSTTPPTLEGEKYPLRGRLITRGSRTQGTEFSPSFHFPFSFKHPAIAVSIHAKVLLEMLTARE